MKKHFLLIAFCVITSVSSAQFIYKIKAGSVLITNDSCNAELNLENSTRHTLGGFLYNKGNGRTEFRRGAINVNGTPYTIGKDSINITTGSGGGWVLTGNTGTNHNTNFVGTIDNAHLAFRTNNTVKMFITNAGLVGFGTVTPSTQLHAYGLNPTLYLEGDGSSYYTGIAIKSIFGTAYIDNYGINGVNGTYISRTTTNNKRVAVGTAPSGGVSISEDSAMITHRIVSARNQVADILRINKNTATVVGSVTETQLFSVNKDGNIWSSAYATFAKTGFMTTTVQTGSNGTDAEGIRITGNSIPTPALRIDNVAYAIANGKGIIDITANHTYMYGGEGTGAALKYTVTAFNSSPNQHWGVYMDMQDTLTGSSAPIFTYGSKVKTVNGSAYAFYADATVKSGGTGIPYAFYAHAGQSHFNNKLTIDGPNGYTQLRLTDTYTPTSSADTNGQTGDFAWDTNYIYIKTASGWKRSALSTF